MMLCVSSTVIHSLLYTVLRTYPVLKLNVTLTGVRRGVKKSVREREKVREGGEENVKQLERK